MRVCPVFLLLLILLTGCFGASPSADPPPAHTPVGYMTLQESGTGVAAGPLPRDPDFAPGQFSRWSPDGRYLVYGKEGDLWLYDALSDRSRNLTATPDRWELMPAWSPGGERIAFVSRPLVAGEGGGPWTTMHGCFCGVPTVIGRDGSGYRELDRTPAYHPPSWSPDGQTLAYGGDGAIRLYDFKIGLARDLALTGTMGGVPFVGAPSYSPVTGDMAFFFSESVVEPTRDQVLLGTAPGVRQGYGLFDPRTAQARVLYEYRAPFSPVRPPALWSGSGRRLALDLTCQLYLCDPVGLYVVDLASGKTERVTADSYQAVWEPDGGRLAYIDNRDRQSVGILTFTEGGWQRQTLRPGHYLEGISWRPAPLTAWLGDALDVDVVQVADTDDDGVDDVIAAARPGRRTGLPSRGPVLVFRGADLRAGTFRPHVFTHGGDFRRVERIADVNGDGRSEVVTTYQGHGSGGNITWFFHQWDGHGYRRIFDADISNWRGPNDLTIGPGQVTLTCRPMGWADHKFAAHRQHTEVWRWDGTAYRFALHLVPAAPSDRQGVNDAEPFFRNQEYATALALYRRVLTLPREAGERDWQEFARTRISQGVALLGQGPGTGAAAAVPAPGAVAVELPPAVALQDFLQRGGDWRLYKRAGLPVSEVTAADLDGDGQPEVWARGLGDQTASFLAVRTAAGWRVGEILDYGPEPQVVPAPDGRGRAFLFRKFAAAWPSQATIGWDGHAVRVWSEGEGPAAFFTTPLQPPAIPRCREPMQWLADE